MMSNTFVLPSYFGIPFATDIPRSKYDSKGRQLSFVETKVQRLERMALVNASKSHSSSPKTRSRQPSSSSGMKLIPEFMANHLAEEDSFNDEFSFLKLSAELEPQLEILDSSGAFLVPISYKPSSSQPGHKHKRSLSSIREED